jgi:hypothetical protein
MTQDELKEQFNYDPETGLFTRIKSKGGRPIGEVAGCLRSNGYLYLMVNFKSVSCHRAAFLFMIGEFPKGQVDHVNRDKTDNRWANLRDVSQSENERNKSPRSSTGVRGVYYDKRCLSPYLASLQKNGKTYTKTGFDTIEQATAARRSLELEHWV